jgi:hypothetical protein
LPTSSNNSPKLTFEPRWSPQRCAVVSAQFLVCVVIPWLIPYWPVLARTALAFAAVAVLGLGYRRVGWWGPKLLRRVTWQQSGRWVLQRQCAEQEESSDWILSPNSFVTSWLMVLRWQYQSETLHIIILPKELPLNVWRQWQARLKLHGSKVLHASDTEL